MGWRDTITEDAGVPAPKKSSWRDTITTDAGVPYAGSPADAVVETRRAEEETARAKVKSEDQIGGGESEFNKFASQPTSFRRAMLDRRASDYGPGLTEQWSNQYEEWRKKNPEAPSIDATRQSEGNNEELLRRAGHAIRGIAQGVTLGWGDELAGKVESTVRDIPYETARDNARVRNASAQVSSPNLYNAGQLGGSLLVPSVGVASTNKITSKLVPSVVDKMSIVYRALLRGAGAGAVGASLGAGAYEGSRVGERDPEELKSAAKYGALWGAAGSLGEVGRDVAKRSSHGLAMEKVSQELADRETANFEEQKRSRREAALQQQLGSEYPAENLLTPKDFNTKVLENISLMTSQGLPGLSTKVPAAASRVKPGMSPEAIKAMAQPVMHPDGTMRPADAYAALLTDTAHTEAKNETLPESKVAVGLLNDLEKDQVLSKVDSIRAKGERGDFQTSANVSDAIVASLKDYAKYGQPGAGTAVLSMLEKTPEARTRLGNTVGLAGAAMQGGSVASQMPYSKDNARKFLDEHDAKMNDEKYRKFYQDYLNTYSKD